MTGIMNKWTEKKKEKKRKDTAQGIRDILKMQSASCLAPVRRFPSLSRSIHLGDVSVWRRGIMRPRNQASLQASSPIKSALASPFAWGPRVNSRYSTKMQNQLAGYPKCCLWQKTGWSPILKAKLLIFSKSNYKQM